MDYKHKNFCDEYVKTLDFNLSCETARVNKNKTLAQLYDKTSELCQYVQKQMDVCELTNSFVSNDFVKLKLASIMITGSSRDKIQAAKVLLGYDENTDKTAEFINLINSIKPTTP